METALGFVEPRKLSKNEKISIRSLLVEANNKAKECSERIYGTSNISRFRRDLTAGDLSGKLSEDEHKLFESAVDQSYNLLQCYCRAASKFAKSFANSKPTCGMTYEDFYQTGCIAICECVLGFNDTATLTTYVFNSIKNKMIDMIRGDDFMSPKAAYIRKLAAKIKKYIKDHSVGFDEAVIALEISKKQAEVCKKSMVKVWTGYGEEENRVGRFSTGPAHHDGNRAYMFVDPDSAKEREVIQLKEIINKSGLTNLEMKLVENYLWGHQTLREFVKDHINPKTEKSISVQWASRTLKVAIEKIKEKAAA